LFLNHEKQNEDSDFVENLNVRIGTNLEKKGGDHRRRNPGYVLERSDLQRAICTPNRGKGRGEI